ncbi:MAG: transglutaminase domain-containing protein [Chloroflexi bacterium]|nr:transglutaminase domain-containing protein [Chloroflexota bacterium]
MPPANRDAVDWVLFDLRRGYCNYYASAMVVMLRTMGIPARMAAGFAQGEWDAG